MIIKKSWKQIKYDKDTYTKTQRYVWQGWFLFGIIPLYLIRTDI